MKCLEERCCSSDVQLHAYTLVVEALRAHDEHHRLARLGVSHPPLAQDVTCQEEANHSYEEQEAATQAEPDVDEVLAVKGQVKEGFSEESEVEKESHVERIIEMEDGGQLGENEAYMFNEGGTRSSRGNSGWERRSTNLMTL
ncbi:hypothetical protein RHGRI_033111 [Rhododendron griersonianum]|uniref:Uncharacterized protein n=1 Tax=Rhododendron griersonianum TaxID=479676 RepID=A0AAV6HYP2_9ERIC|nr:hypothetical protein RHGRI_033111 [Rhododendron griersonianum]